MPEKCVPNHAVKVRNSRSETTGKLVRPSKSINPSASFVCLVVVAIAFVSCAGTSLTSIKRADFGSPKEGNLIIFAEFHHLDERLHMEHSIVEGLSARTMGCKFYPASSLLMPGDDFSDEEIDNLLMSRKIDYVLWVRPTIRGQETTTEISRVSEQRVRDIFGSYSSVTVTDSYQLSKPWAHWEVLMIAAGTSKVVWYATARSGGSILTSQMALAKSASDEIIKSLMNDRIFRVAR